jgi:hypothetical protein
MKRVAGVLLKEEVVVHAAGGGGGVPVGNGDGKIDISDAVYTLSWLFAGGHGAGGDRVPGAGREGAPGHGADEVL